MPATDAALLDELTGPAGGMSRAAAEAVLRWRFSDGTLDRMRTLAAKHADAALTEAGGRRVRPPPPRRSIRGCPLRQGPEGGGGIIGRRLRGGPIGGDAGRAGRRPGGRCECFRLPDALTLTPFTLDHDRPRKHRGGDGESNRAYACFQCNAHKGPNASGFDPMADALVPLFSPRRQTWSDHFFWSGPYLGGKNRGRSRHDRCPLHQPAGPRGAAKGAHRRGRGPALGRTPVTSGTPPPTSIPPAPPAARRRPAPRSSSAAKRPTRRGGRPRRRRGHHGLPPARPGRAGRNR